MPSNHARNVALTPELDKFVEDLVASGAYGNASEVVRDGLRELHRRKTAEELAEMQARIGRGLDQLDRGEGVEGAPDEVLGAVLDAVRKRRAK